LGCWEGMGSSASRSRPEDRGINQAWDDSDNMSFWRKDKEKVNYKARLEHKRYLAQESPEPVFDISECALKNVPAGIYSRCKVARKEALLLQENELTSITGGGNLSDLQDLHVLDLHKNCLEKLPDDIGQLKNLRVLYLQQNKLKSLPSSLGNLAKLTTLNLSENALKEVPVALSSLTSLKTLDLRSNPKLKKIPKEIAALRCLETLLLDETAITYPTPSIVCQGTEAIMRFLCQESGLDYIPPSQAIPLQEQNGTNGNTSNGNGCPLRDPYEDLVKDHLDKAERLKEERRKQNLELELSRQRDQEKEVELKKLSEMNKKKLLEDMAEEESRNDNKLVELQRQRENERKILNSRMMEAEQQSDEVISRLMQDGAKLSDPAKVMAALEADRQAMEKQFTIVQGDVDKLKAAEVLRAMQEEMEAEIQRKATARQYAERQGVVSQAMASTLENDKAVEEALAAKGKHQEEIISKMLEDEKYQREAFQTLLLRQDDRAAEIQDQLAMVQNELAALTMVEMKKRDMKVEFETEMMKDKRDKLTQLLMDLMERQKQRAEDLQRMMGEMETTRVEEQENYWLIQYQKLLDSKPKGLEEAEGKMDAKVKQLLVDCGAEELVPVFAKKKVTFKEVAFLSEVDLKQMGISSEFLRRRVLSAIAGLVQQEDLARTKLEGGAGSENGAASAPSEDDKARNDGGEVATAPEDIEPSAPVETFQSAECVVCLERKCDIIFLPCGHLCSCSSCQQSLATCPLCRANVLQRVRI